MGTNAQSWSASAEISTDSQGVRSAPLFWLHLGGAREEVDLTDVA